MLLTIVLTACNIMFDNDQLLLDCVDDHVYLGLPLMMDFEAMNNPARLAPLTRYIYPNSVALMEMYGYGDIQYLPEHGCHTVMMCLT